MGGSSLRQTLWKTRLLIFRGGKSTTTPIGEEAPGRENASREKQERIWFGSSIRKDRNFRKLARRYTGFRDCEDAGNVAGWVRIVAVRNATRRWDAASRKIEKVVRMVGGEAA